LIVLDAWGHPVETFWGSLINGPWDMTAVDGDDEAILFVTNVLNGTLAASSDSMLPGNIVNQGNVIRINLGVSEKQMPWIESITVIGSGFEERTDPAALVIGPTGVGLSPSCEEGDKEDCKTIFGDDDGRVLYVADSLRNRIQAIPHALHRTTSAGEGVTFSSGGSLNGPLGLTVSEGGHVLAVNSGDGFITEINQHGTQIAKELLDGTGMPPGAGALFGLAFNSERKLVFVDDASNTLNLLH
jgi:DNA-binding beta-propeller fold protein YncE